MQYRKFEVLSVVLNPGGPGPERLWECKCRYIKNKQWIEKTLLSIGRTADEAKRNLEQRFSGRN
jgi:hypothetical protein